MDNKVYNLIILVQDSSYKELLVKIIEHIVNKYNCINLLQITYKNFRSVFNCNRQFYICINKMIKQISMLKDINFNIIYCGDYTSKIITQIGK